MDTPNSPATPPSSPTAPDTPPPAKVDPPAPTSAAPATSPDDAPTGAVVTLPTRDFAAIKKRARASERARVLDELAAKAKEAGFDSLDALFSGAKAALEAPPAAPSEDRSKELAEARTQVATLEAKLRTAERELRRAKVEFAREKQAAILRDLAREAGAVDPEDILLLLRAHVRTLEPAALGKFDPKQFFEDLRTRKPHLFAKPATETPPPAPKVVDEPLHTGPSGTPAPKPGGAGGAPAKKNAMEMTPKEFEDWLRNSLGVRPPSALI